MVSHVIEKQVDIWHYPEEIDGSLGSVTLGDLHGNAVKLLHFLIRHGVVKFKEGVDAKAEYQKFVDIYAENGKFTHENSLLIMDKEDYILKNKASIEKYNDTLKGRTPDQIEQIARDKASIARLENNNTKLQKEIDELRGIALTQVEKIRKDIDIFRNVIENIEIANNDIFVRLIGDEVADRGSNDYFTLKILEKLSNHNVNYTILLSNHSLDFIRAYESQSNNPDQALIVPTNSSIGHSDERPSLAGLQNLLRAGIVNNEEFQSLTSDTYKPHLKLLDYTLTENGITLFSHAPISYSVIKNLADHLQVPYSDTTNVDLAKTIDKINNKVKIAAENGRLRELINVEGYNNSPGSMIEEKDIKKFPLLHTIWNRWSDTKDHDKARPNKINDFQVTYVHGHDNYVTKHPHVINLDTEIGKYPRDYEPNISPEDPEPIKLKHQQHLISLKKYKVLDSNESGLVKKPAPIIDSELVHHQNDARTSKFALIASAIGFGLGLIVGLALTLTGVFAPLGLGIIGLVAMAASISGAGAAIGAGLGIGVAKGTEPAVEAVAPNPVQTGLRAIAQMGGKAPNNRSSLENTSSLEESKEEVVQVNAQLESNPVTQDAQTKPAPDVEPTPEHSAEIQSSLIVKA